MLTPFMAPGRNPADSRLAPASSSGATLRLPGAAEPRPYLDERLVEPETREEMVRGQRVFAAPAKPEHADRHSELDYVVRAHVAHGYRSSSDLLTRAQLQSDFATDACVRRDGIDPRTGFRYLEELAFEVVNEQSLRAMTTRAEDLTQCGVRRIFAILVKKGDVLEWSPAESRWRLVEHDEEIEDPTLIRPLRARALLDAAEADDAVAHALKAKNNPVIVETRAEGHSEGFTQGHAKGLAQGLAQGRIEMLCEMLGIPLGPREHEQLRALDVEGLASLRARLESERRWP
jgi:hypothetical protein